MIPEKKEECDCIQKLDKLRMDLEAGKDIGFVLVYFYPADEDKGAGPEYNSIAHNISARDIMLGVLELQVKAMKLRGDIE